MSVRAPVSVCAVAAIALSACQTNEPPGGPLVAQVQAESPTRALQIINQRGLDCWIKSGEARFSRLALVPELDTRSGDPRILIVERGNPQGLPRLVITASGKPVTLRTFGPLTSANLSQRINNDIAAWMIGQTGCDV